MFSQAKIEQAICKAEEDIRNDNRTLMTRKADLMTLCEFPPMLGNLDLLDRLPENLIERLWGLVDTGLFEDDISTCEYFKAKLKLQFHVDEWKGLASGCCRSASASVLCEKSCKDESTRDAAKPGGRRTTHECRFSLVQFITCQFSLSTLRR